MTKQTLEIAKKIDAFIKRRKRNACIAIILIMALLIIISITTIWISSSYYQISGVPVLNYHQINDENITPLAVRVSHFRDEMDYLKNNGYHTITMDELYDYLAEGAPLPDKPVLITFDDGYIDNYVNAYPILKERHMKATLFMIGDAIDTEPSRFLTTEQLQDMDKNGFSIEAHTYAHKKLTKFEEEALYNDLTKSKEVLEQILHRPVNYLAYPGGFNNKLVQATTEKAGYRLAFTVQPGNVMSGDNLYALNRLSIFEGMDSWFSFRFRLHVAPIIASMWSLRDYLRDNGYTTLSQVLPLY